MDNINHNNLSEKHLFTFTEGKVPSASQIKQKFSSSLSARPLMESMKLTSNPKIIETAKKIKELTPTCKVLKSGSPRHDKIMSEMAKIYDFKLHENGDLSITPVGLLAIGYNYSKTKSKHLEIFLNEAKTLWENLMSQRLNKEVDEKSEIESTIEEIDNSNESKKLYQSMAEHLNKGIELLKPEANLLFKDHSGSKFVTNFTAKAIYEKLEELNDKLSKLSEDSDINDLQNFKKEAIESLEDILADPVTLELFENPCLASDGHTYSEETLKSLKDSPLTRDVLSDKYVPNQIVSEFVNFFNQLKK